MMMNMSIKKAIKHVETSKNRYAAMDPLKRCKYTIAVLESAQRFLKNVSKKSLTNEVRQDMI